MDDYTLIIPTYQRPVMLRAQLLYLRESFPGVRVLILDSSTTLAATANAATVREFPFVEYRTFDSATPFARKLLLGLRDVATPYVSLCADDDLLFPVGLTRCVEELRRRPELAAAHGTYIHFAIAPNPPQVVALGREYEGPSINSPHAGARLVQLYKRYEALYYAVCRTPQLREIFEIQAGFDSLLFQELFQATALVLLGPTVRLPEVYCARRNSPPVETHRKRWHPMYWAVQDGLADLVTNYLTYRQQVVKWWQKCEPELPREKMENLCDLAHYIYLRRDLPPDYLYPAAATMLGIKGDVLQQDLPGLIEDELQAIQRGDPNAIETRFSRRLRGWTDAFKREIDRWAQRRIRKRVGPAQVGDRAGDFPVVFSISLYGGQKHPGLMRAATTIHAQMLREQEIERQLASTLTGAM